MNAPDPVQRCWDDLTSRRGCAAAPAAGAVFEEITGAYRELHRHYHTLDHIRALLALLARFGGAAADRDALTLVVLFHDIVYDPRRQDNEEASASLAAERLAGLGFPGGLVAKVARYIVATRHDQPVEEIADADLALLLDLDLSILAAAPTPIVPTRRPSGASMRSCPIRSTARDARGCWRHSWGAGTSTARSG
jgi:predicted metal-dependent HD superfamily phosphohydrolase